MRKFTLLFALSALLLFLAACGESEDGNTDKDTASEDKQETMTVEHELGKTDVQKNKEKVVVFDFGTLDTLDMLGIEVVGVSQGNIPTYLEKYGSDDFENVGSLKEPDFEKIAEVDPDLIIISGRQSELYDQLQDIAPTIYLGVDTTRYMDSFKENLATIGEIFDKETEVEEELGKIEDAISTVKEEAEASDKNSLIILANDDKISAYGPNSRFGLIHDVFGVPAVDDTIEASTHGMNVSFEYEIGRA